MEAETERCNHKPRNPAPPTAGGGRTDLPLEIVEGVWPSQHLDLELLVLRIVRG